jgi:uncharacterized protein
MYQRFSLVLMVNHACNLRCTYCYTGAKFQRPMPEAIGTAAIDRALASLAAGGTLQLGFFGGEPLVEAALVRRLIAHARRRAAAASCGVELSLTTNGTQTSDEAWSVMTDPAMDLAVSHDGRADVHDRDRVFADGRGSSAAVLATIGRLVAADNPFRVAMVVRPSNVDHLGDGIAGLREAGVRSFDLSLDLWTRWSADDARRLEAAVAEVAEVWAAALPALAVNWLDDKAGRLASVPVSESARCGFGAGEIAVAPSGRLYPCERLIGEDLEDNPVRLPGTALEGTNFLAVRPAPVREDPACSACAMEAICSTTCRCSNYVRTGRVDRPDGLLCRLEQACVREVGRVLKERAAQPPAPAGMEDGHGREAHG